MLNHIKKWLIRVRTEYYCIKAVDKVDNTDFSVSNDLTQESVMIKKALHSFRVESIDELAFSKLAMESYTRNTTELSRLIQAIERMEVVKALPSRPLTSLPVKQYFGPQDTLAQFKWVILRLRKLYARIERYTDMSFTLNLIQLNHDTAKLISLMRLTGTLTYLDITEGTL